MVNYNQIYEFVEPHVCGGEAYVRVSAKEAIDFMRKQEGDKYTDEELLDSFVAIHWAYKVSL